MNPILKTLALIVGLIVGVLFTAQAVPQFGIVGALVGLMLVVAIGNSARLPSARLMATLSVTEILMDTLDAYKQMVPMLSAFSTDFSSATAVKDQQIIAHIAGLPTVQDYDVNQGGFKNGATAVTDLLTDVPVTLDRLKHVPVKVAYLSQLASRKDLYKEAIRNNAYVLGKSMVDYALTLAVAANFTHESAFAVNDSDLDALEHIRTDLNGQSAAPVGRFGFVNSTVSAVIQADERVASGDYYGQLNGGSGYRRFTNIAGFENVWEYPDFPANGENLTGFFGDKRAVVIASRRPDMQNLAQQLGIPTVMRFESVTDPETGLTLTGIAWQEQGTADVYVSVAVLYGAKAGAQGGAADSKTDKSGHLLVTA